MIRKEPKSLSHGERDAVVRVGAALPQPNSSAIVGALAGAALVGGFLVFGAKHHVDAVLGLAMAGAAVVGGVMGQYVGGDSSA